MLYLLLIILIISVLANNGAKHYYFDWSPSFYFSSLFDDSPSPEEEKRLKEQEARVIYERHKEVNKDYFEVIDFYKKKDIDDPKKVSSLAYKFCINLYRQSNPNATDLEFVDSNLYRDRFKVFNTYLKDIS